MQPPNQLQKQLASRRQLHSSISYRFEHIPQVCLQPTSKFTMEKHRSKSKKHSTHCSRRKEMRARVIQQLKAIQPPQNATSQQKIQALVKQADFYANFLLSKVESKGKQRQGDQADQPFTRLEQQPSLLKGGELKYYQLIALNWLISLYESGISGILADDMGLGKTIQTISMLAFLKQFKDISGPHLIIAPKVTLGNWMRQLQKWLPSLRALKLQATKEEREVGLATISQGNFDVVVTSYEGIRLGESKLKKIKWQYLVIDQAHKIKNQESLIAQKVRILHNQCKLLLTGTPLQNNLHQLWSLMNFLIPEVFKSSEPFDNWNTAEQQQQGKTEAEVKQQIEKRNVQMISQLHKILRPFMLRRTKAEVEKSLPGKKEIHVYVGLSQVQLKIYRNLLQNRNASQEQKRHYLNLLMQLRKVCCHPYLFPNVQPSDASPIGEHIVTASGKMIILDKLLGKLHKEGDHKVLIFSQMTSLLDIFEDFCHLRNYSYCRIDGSTDMKSRQDQIEAFMTTNQHFLFLLSTRAGGLGINLTAADTVILYDSDFNPQMDLQAMDRAHRIGQKKFVRVYRLVTENTVEEKIIERQMIKLKWDNLVIQQQKTAHKNKALTKQEMKEMLQHGASTIFKATDKTISEAEIEDLLNKGEAKTDALNHSMEKQMKAPADLASLNMDSINIFDFMQRDQEKKAKDAQSLRLMSHKEKEEQTALEYRGRREKAKQVRVKVEKRVVLPQHHFYEQKERLLCLLQKEEDYKNNKGMEECPPLSLEESRDKERLMATGFQNWNKADFNSFISANQKYGRNSLQEISKYLNKNIEEVQAFSQRFWTRIDQLAESQKILKFIQGGQSKMQSQKQQYQLLEWKRKRCHVMEFNPLIYNKFKSKLFSVDADVFLAEAVLKYGVRAMQHIKEEIRQTSIFRFDHYLKTRSEADLNKRMLSIYKELEKEKQTDLYGLDNVAGEKRKRVRPWERSELEREGKRKGKKVKK